jgi:hypothetical protein
VDGLMPTADVAPAPGTVYLVAPSSLRAWFGDFVDLGPDDVVEFVGEGPAIESATVDALLSGRGGPRLVVLYSGHDSLERDLGIAEQLRQAGHAVHSQSESCTRLGLDKAVLKQFFVEHGFPTPLWGTCGTPAATQHPVVVKSRFGTQSRGIRFETAPEAEIGDDEYWEEYVEGTEYSVLVHAGTGQPTTFPPVWKGRTTTELTPPWMRLRACPPFGLSTTVEAELRDVAVSLCRAAGAVGFVEVEFVLTAEGQCQVLEINPRISGTMRIASMAADVRLFSLPLAPGATGDLRAVRCAAEIPYAGQPFRSPESGVFASSRLTVAGRTFAEIAAKLTQVAPDDGRGYLLLREI